MIPNRRLNCKENRQTFVIALSIILVALLAGCGRSERTAADQTPTPAQPGTPVVLPTATNPAAPMPTPTPTPTPTFTPSPTPAPHDRLVQGQREHRYGDYAAARNEFTAVLNAADADPRDRLTARLDLGRAYLIDGFYEEALNAFDTLLDELDATPTDTDPDLRAKAHYLRGAALAALNRPDEASAAYALALEGAPWMTEFIQQRIGQVKWAAGDLDGATAAYRTAADDLSADRSPVSLVRLLETLADLHLRAGRYDEAVAVYDEILAMARIPAYRADIQNRAGQALASAGDEEAAIQRWLAATEEAPASQSAYSALVELVNREAPFDLYQRGYIDLKAEAWYPAIAAYQAFLAEAEPSDPQTGQAWVELAQAYLGAGDYANANAALAQVIEGYGDCDCFGQAWLLSARSLADQGDRVGARRVYRTFARDYPDQPLAAEALWRSGLMAFADDNQVEAALDFRALADGFPDNERAPKALYIVGLSALQAGLPDQAVDALTRVQETYPDHRSLTVSYWLGRAYHAAGDAEAGARVWKAGAAQTPDLYYGILDAQSLRQPRLETNVLVDEMGAITGPPSTLEDDDGSQAYAETWLANWLAEGDGGNDRISLSEPPAAIAEDPDLAAARFLLDVDARGDALLAAGRLYEQNKDDPQSLYALSLLFEKMGLYRLSMISMARLLEFSPARLVEDTPIFLQKRVYPQPFADLIVQEAETNGLDPLLYFSLIRQESQFEEGARSSAAAQGLAQIIPDTGHWVAAQLGHPDYSNEQIYLPYVNLRFGAYYLGWVRDYLDGNLISALVGYNAGPGNARNWRQRYGDDDPWYIERLDFNEPRVYVQTILQNLYHYNRLYVQTP